MGDALYTVHSWDIPYAQENTSLNYCWQAHNGEVKLAPFCQVFILRTPGLYKGAKDRLHTMSFESVCLPGYFLKQKNYHMILQKRDGSDLFGEDIVFFFFSCCAFIFVFLFTCLLACFVFFYLTSLFDCLLLWMLSSEYCKNNLLSNCNNWVDSDILLASCVSSGSLVRDYDWCASEGFSLLHSQRIMILSRHDRSL